MRFVTSVLAVVLGLLGPFGSTLAIAGSDSDVAAPDVRTADQIIGLVAETYKNCRTYRDSGVVRTLFFGSDGRVRTERRPFSTAFVRPDRFRFEYQSHLTQHGQPIRYIVWRQGQDVRSWWDIRPGVKTEDSLNLAAPIGVSGRSAVEVPALLLPSEIPNGSLEAMQTPTRLEDAKLGKINCLRIRGYAGGHTMTFWIDSKTLLIQRIDWEQEFKDFRTEESILYDAPVINEPIPEEKLAFAPPTEDASNRNVP